MCAIKTTNNVVLTEEVLIVWERVRGMGITYGCGDFDALRERSW